MNLISLLHHFRKSFYVFPTILSRHKTLCFFFCSFCASGCMVGSCTVPLLVYFDKLWIGPENAAFFSFGWVIKTTNVVDVATVCYASRSCQRCQLSAARGISNADCHAASATSSTSAVADDATSATGATGPSPLPPLPDPPAQLPAANAVNAVNAVSRLASHVSHVSHVSTLEPRRLVARVGAPSAPAALGLQAHVQAVQAVLTAPGPAPSDTSNTSAGATAHPALRRWAESPANAASSTTAPSGPTVPSGAVCGASSAQNHCLGEARLVLQVRKLLWVAMLWHHTHEMQGMQGQLLPMVRPIGEENLYLSPNSWWWNSFICRDCLQPVGCRLLRSTNSACTLEKMLGMILLGDLGFTPLLQCSLEI